ncbi:MAG: hypothetical protein J07HQW1_03415 [Haloquadratum walsbyi J07HQW1]|jgi:hypothetical protein|uniref:Uncharacterized protein n=1 Tax=Haloquadratum walsbyi J07HQW1 TaxID=1238424 RepID=U1MT12_9EURY|nr:MAG: hypothetical protein J07HQW1_03415 [Haloquadratum walsbyi J07HQW1]
MMLFEHLLYLWKKWSIARIKADESTFITFEMSLLIYRVSRTVADVQYRGNVLMPAV